MAPLPLSPPSPFVQLAKTLPPPLQRFLARWPPAAILPNGGADATPTPHQTLWPDPFRFVRHPATGSWHDPVYSARRQAQLVRMARHHGVEELLPESAKALAVRLARRVEHGLRVRGTGVGQKVKGHMHERHMISKMEEKRRTILAMPKLIRAWKRIGKKNWTKWPK